MGYTRLIIIAPSASPLPLPSICEIHSDREGKLIMSHSRLKNIFSCAFIISLPWVPRDLPSSEWCLFPARALPLPQRSSHNTDDTCGLDEETPLPPICEMNSRKRRDRALSRLCSPGVPLVLSCGLHTSGLHTLVLACGLRRRRCKQQTLSTQVADDKQPIAVWNLRHSDPCVHALHANMNMSIRAWSMRT